MNKIIAANWKMNKTKAEATQFFNDFTALNIDTKNKDIVFCVPFTCLEPVAKLCKKLKVTPGAQNFHPAKNGAYTGEISAQMLNELGAKVVLVGHSERRALFGETDAFINEKVKAGLANGLYVLLCIGESLAERESNKTNNILKRQLTKDLADIFLVESKTYTVAVAYEPVWAIGTGKVATIEQIAETHKFIKATLSKMYPGVTIPVLYGGSVNDKNATEILSVPGVDGVLVGGASLEAAKFSKIITA